MARRMRVSLASDVPCADESAGPVTPAMCVGDARRATGHMTAPYITHGAGAFDDSCSSA